MQRPSKKPRSYDAEEKESHIRSNPTGESPEEDEEDNWEEMSSDDGYLAEEGLGPLDIEEIVESESEDDDEAYNEFQKESSAQANVLAEKIKGVTFDEDSLRQQKEDEEAAIVWRSDQHPGSAGGEALDYSNKAYDSFFQLRTEFPFLSFSVIKDNDGANRTKYPFSMLLVGGSQADAADRNHLAILRVHNICRTKHDVPSDDDSEDSFIGGDQEEGSDDDEKEDDDEEEVNNGEPLVEHRTIRHFGSANRVAISPFANFSSSQYVAVWSDAGHVQVFDIDHECRALVDYSNWAKEEAAQWRSKAAKSGEGSEKSALRFCTPSNTHRTEGYGLAWSALRTNTFASGDCNGALFVWEPADDGRWRHTASSQGTSSVASHEPTASIEDIAWSPTQREVLLTARAEGMVEVWDTRDMRRPKLSWRADVSDINVADWNRARQASHLLVTGAESGAVSVWDLRHVGGAAGNPTPIQNLVWHTKRISSVEFSVHNESVLAVTSDDSQCTLWDLSLERDVNEEQEMVGDLFGRDDLVGIPDSLMFQHQGLVAPKEVHWHPQIPGMVVTTDYNGLHLFKPMNWRSLMK